MLLQCSSFPSGNALKDTNVCDGIKVGDEVSFEVTLESTHCVDRRDFDLHIGPSGLDETLLLNVHVICDCDCEESVGEHPADLELALLQPIEYAQECSGKGTLICGVCKCPPGFVGDHCQCESGGESEFSLENKCRK